MLTVGLGREFESVVSREAEREGLLLVTMCKEDHLAVLFRGFNEHVDGKIGDGQLARSLAGGVVVGLAVEIERGGLRDTGGIGHTEYLEVVILVKPVAGDRFTEAQLDIPVKFEDAVSR